MEAIDLPIEYTGLLRPLIAIAGLSDLKEPDLPDTAEKSAPVAKRYRQELRAYRLKLDILTHLMSLGSLGSWEGRWRVLELKDVIIPQKTASILSPSNPDSQLYPDGIMSPNYIARLKKIPSIILCIQTLWEPHERDPLGMPSSIERDHDQIMCTFIIEQRRKSLERLLKFVVIILIQSPRIQGNDDTALDERLSFIRRACGMDRNNLLVCPASNQDGESKSADVLMEPIMKLMVNFSAAYYREEERKKKKKKARGGSSLRFPTAKPPPTHSSIRFDFKMGAISELRFEPEVAISFYESAYVCLGALLKQSIRNEGKLGDIDTTSSRFYEARVLFDSLCFKV